MLPNRLGNNGKILKDKAMVKPRPTIPAVSEQCTTKGLGFAAEAPVILSSPRTTKTDSYELVWKPRHDGKVPILYYLVKHRKVSIFCLSVHAYVPCFIFLAELLYLWKSSVWLMLLAVYESS